MCNRNYQSIHCPKKIHWQSINLALIIICSTFANLFFTHPTHAKSCDDVQFIFARGSGEKLNDTSYQSWKTEITNQLSSSSLKYSFYELGSSNQAGYQYPAVAVSGDFQGITNLLGAYIGAGQAYEFGESVMQGEIELNVYTRRINSGCPNTKFVLGGYSQGAMLITQSLDDLISENILYATTFGDPKLYLPEGKGGFGRLNKIPDACKGKSLSPYRIDVADCYAYEGVLGSVRPYQPPAYDGKIGAWCNNHDIMCSSGLSIDDHTSYVAENIYQDVAYKIYQKLRQTFPNKFTASQKTPQQALHDVVFLFDITGSMSYAFSRYVGEAKNLAKTIVENGGRISLFTYGDLQDDIFPDKLCRTSCTLAEFNTSFDDLIVNKGGDEPESLLSALMSAMNQTSWRRNATKSIVVLTDATYHDPDFDNSKTSLKDVVQRSLEIDPVNIYVVTQSKLAKFYKNLTTSTGGQVYDYTSDANIQLSTDQIFQRPVAKLSLENYASLVGEEITFDASMSYSLDDSDLTFDWDLNGDGDFELTNAAPIIQKTYGEEFSDYIQVRVHDDESFSTMSAKVSVTSSPPVIAEITSVSVHQTSDSSAKITFATNAERALILVNDMPAGFIIPQNSQGNFTLQEIAKNTQITLVPYLNQTRGVSYQLEVDGNYQPPVASTAQTSVPTITSETPTNKPIPTAPDTGSFTY